MISATDSGKGNEALRSTRFTAGNDLADAPDETTDQRLKAEVRIAGEAIIPGHSGTLNTHCGGAFRGVTLDF